MKYSNTELCAMVDEFRALDAEPSWLEFKTGMKDPVQIAKYISGLSNVAAYAGNTHGYLVWGVNDKTHEVETSDFDPDVVKAEKNQPLRLWLKLVLKPQIEFEFYPFEYDGRKGVLLEVEAAYRQPVTFRGVGYVRIGSALTELSKEPKIAASIYRTLGHDWSADIVHGAGIEDLDPAAIAYARELFADRHKGEPCAEESKSWDIETFLNKAKMAIDGKLTRAGILLLGKAEKSHLVSPAFARITWHLMDKDGNTLDFKHFGLPFIFAARDALAKIRSITLRVMPDDSFIPVDIAQYDAWVLRESLHNCIAHQDYTRRSDVVVSEFPDRVVFANAGEFRPGSVEKVIYGNSRPRDYPNQQLVDAMVELKMVDTLGSGIRRMYMTQKKNSMPMPDYDLSDDEVKVTVFGKIFDERYARILLKKTNIPLDRAVALDKIQKGGVVDRELAQQLRREGLVEGRYPRLYPAGKIAEKTNRVEDYLEAKAYDDAFYMQRVLEFMCAKGRVTRKQINGLLLRHMSGMMDEKQKLTKIGNLLSLKLKKRLGWIVSDGSTSGAYWSLTNKGREACRKGSPSCKKRCAKL